MNSLTRKLAIFVALVALALAATPAAFAQSSGEGYTGPGGTINERVGGGDPPPTDDSSTPGTTSSNNGGKNGGGGEGSGDSTLPFTGSDLGLLAGGGALLLGLGVGMRRLTRPNAA